MADEERIRHAAGLVVSCPGPAVVVVSAVAGVTDRLERIARLAGQGRGDAWRRELQALESLHLGILAGLREGGEASIRETVARLRARLEEARPAAPPGRRAKPGGDAEWTAEVSAAGEDLSVLLLAAALRARGVRAQVVDAREVVRTERQGGVGIPRDEETYRLARERLGPLVGEGTVPVVQGYIGATEDGRTTTLGRGGSDFTAAIVGAALGSPEVTIWTDVVGIQSADPRIVPGARVLPELGFEEAVELAYFGARVIHPAATKHAAARNVSLRIRSSFDPEAEGTLIRPDRREGPSVAAIAHRERITLITVRSRPLFLAHGFLARVFGVLARHTLPVDLVATSHTSTAFTVDRDQDLEPVREELEELAEVTIRQGLATVTVVGRGLLGRPGTAAAIFDTLGLRPIHLISQASDVSLSFLVAEGEAPAVVRRLHEELIEKGGTR